tara:strand:+ start:63558 stop:63917 length:360 start_codon:yes stop_codon:yes gene_type:complete
MPNITVKDIIAMRQEYQQLSEMDKILYIVSFRLREELDKQIKDLFIKDYNTVKVSLPIGDAIDLTVKHLNENKNIQSLIAHYRDNVGFKEFNVDTVSSGYKGGVGLSAPSSYIYFTMSF